MGGTDSLLVSCSLIRISYLIFHSAAAFMENKSMETLKSSKQEVKDAKLHFSHGLRMTPSLA